jgi:hypothetical protein
MALDSTLPLKDISTRNVSWGLGRTTLPPSRSDFREILKPQPPGSRGVCIGFGLPLVTSYSVALRFGIIHSPIQPLAARTFTDLRAGVKVSLVS